MKSDGMNPFDTRHQSPFGVHRKLLSHVEYHGPILAGAGHLRAPFVQAASYLGSLVVRPCLHHRVENFLKTDRYLGELQIIP